MSKVIGLIGRIASGKTVVADYLVKERGANYYRFSDVLRDVLERLHMPNSRENLQGLGLALRGAFGDGLLAQVLREDIEKDGSDIIVVDGIRYQDEFDMVKALGGKVVYVTAPQSVRYGRVVFRGTRGEAGITLDEFMRCEERQTERMIDDLGAKADHIVENTGSVNDLKRAVDRILG